MLGLPDTIVACLFDLDGVLTRTAEVHAAAWKAAFDPFLASRAAATGEFLAPFDAVEDYRAYVDGRRRLDGARAFLASRGIEVALGTPEDPPDGATLYAIGNRKNELVVAQLAASGVPVYEGSVRFVRSARAIGLRCAVVSSSANARAVLDGAGLSELFEVRIDGRVAAERGLPGKPAPDTFLAAAEALGVTPAAAAVFEDALAGVAAGRAGGFGYVVGVDRAGHAEALRAHGADIVVSDLEELLGQT